MIVGLEKFQYDPLWKPYLEKTTVEIGTGRAGPCESVSATFPFRSVQVKMVTGDQLAIAVETSRRLGLGTDMMEGKELMGDREIGQDLIARVRYITLVMLRSKQATGSWESVKTLDFRLRS